MKAAAMRYADLLENGCFITHHEQDEIAKLLRRLVMTEDEAWDLLEAKQQKAKAKTVTEREALKIAYNALVEIDKETPYPLAKHAAMVVKSVLETPMQGSGMNIKELAKQAGIGFNDGSDLHTTIKRFAELVAEQTHTNNKAKWYQEGYERVSVMNERRSAAICDDLKWNGSPFDCAAAIRARGEK